MKLHATLLAHFRIFHYYCKTTAISINNGENDSHQT